MLNQLFWGHRIGQKSSPVSCWSKPQGWSLSSVASSPCSRTVIPRTRLLWPRTKHNRKRTHGWNRAHLETLFIAMLTFSGDDIFSSLLLYNYMLVSEDSSIVRSKIAQILLTMIFGYLMNVYVLVASNLSFRGGDDETAAATAYCDDESQCRCWMVSAKIAAGSPTLD